MKVSKIAEILNGEIKSFNEDREITKGYASDLLSIVVSGAPSGSVWFTVINNINVAAVALLSEISAVVICQGMKANGNLIEKCREEGIALIETPLDTFSAIKKFVESEG